MQHLCDHRLQKDMGGAALVLGLAHAVMKVGGLRPAAAAGAVLECQLSRGSLLCSLHHTGVQPQATAQLSWSGTTLGQRALRIPW